MTDHVEVLKEMLEVVDVHIKNSPSPYTGWIRYQVSKRAALTAAIKALEAIGNAQRIYGDQTLVAGKSEGSTPFLLIPADAVGGG